MIDLKALIDAEDWLASPLSALGDDSLECLGRRASTLSFAKGQMIFGRFESPTYLAIIKSGMVKVSLTTAAGRERVLDFLGPGKCVGELSVLDRKPKSADVAATERTEIIAISAADFDAESSKDPAALKAISLILCERLRSANAMIEAAEYDRDRRAAAAILRLCARYSTSSSKSAASIPVKLTQEQLGEYAGLSRSNFNRALKSLEKSHFIEYSRKEIRVISVQSLEEFSIS